MRVFVTGAGGFIGSHIVKSLLENDHEVAVLKRKGSNSKRLDSLPISYINVSNDLALFSPAEQRSLSEFHPEAVIHAGWIGVGNSQRNELVQLSNIEMTSNLLDASIKAGVQHFIGFGSQAEYGRCEGAINESQPLAPTTLYGAAKASASLVAGVQTNLHDVQFTWVRVFSTYGPGDEPYWMIQDVAKKLVSRESPSLTPGTQIWDYLYVVDAAEAVRSIVEHKTGLGIINLGSGTAQSIRSIVEQMRDIANPDIQINFGAVPFRDDQVMHLEADISKLTQATGWSPRVPLLEGLKATVASIVEEK